MKYRNEWKHEILYSDMLALRQRMRAVMRLDSHAKEGSYQIRSLYFDNLDDKALREKIDGVNKREKFRIRYYNGDTSFIQLEKKSKINNLCKKEAEIISKQEAQWIVDKKYDWMLERGSKLIYEFYFKIKSQGLQARTIVDYTREPYIYTPGNVRVTLDYHIKTGLNEVDFLNPEAVIMPLEGNPIILEVKWDEFLPSIIRDIVQVRRTRTGAFSKYAACRMYQT